MFKRISVLSLGFAIALGAPLAAVANGSWEATGDESGFQLIAPRVGTAAPYTTPARTTPLFAGAISTDRQYVYISEESGWQIRPMQYALEGGRLVHVDDPAGHMDRLADSRPLTVQQRAERDSSGGN